MCKTNKEGGVGFKDLKAWNLALLTKVLWHIQEKRDSLWIEWVHHIYLKHVELWE